MIQIAHIIESRETLTVIKKSCWYSLPITKKHGTTSIPYLNQQKLCQFISVAELTFGFCVFCLCRRVGAVVVKCMPLIFCVVCLSPSVQLTFCVCVCRQVDAVDILEYGNPLFKACSLCAVHFHNLN